MRLKGTLGKFPLNRAFLNRDCNGGATIIIPIQELLVLGGTSQSRGNSFLVDCREQTHRCNRLRDLLEECQPLGVSSISSIPYRFRV